jgi:hypothetical protein
MARCCVPYVLAALLVLAVQAYATSMLVVRVRFGNGMRCTDEIELQMAMIGIDLVLVLQSVLMPISSVSEAPAPRTK